ncbi:serine hydrolase [Thiolapillus sp.]
MSKWLVACCLLLISGAAGASGYPALWDSRDSLMQAGLEKLLHGRGLWDAVAAGELAIVVVDITEPHHPRLATVNGDKMLYAASLPKIAILLGAFVEMENGHLKPDGQLWKDMHRMIRHSDNAAATRVLRAVGHDRLLQILQQPGLALYDPAHGGGLWVGKEYSSKGAYQRDPLHGISHGATAMQVARFYYLLETGRLVNASLTLQMKEILALPAIPHKFVKGLKTLPKARLYRKSGTWKDYHADSALVEEGENRYILVALARHKDAGKWLVDLALPLRDLVIQTAKD